MAISSPARGVQTLQTSGNDYAVAYDASVHNPEGRGASIIKVQSVANGWAYRVNGDDTLIGVITAGTIDYIRSTGPGGINKLEVKNLVTDTNGTGYWTDAVCV